MGKLVEEILHVNRARYPFTGQIVVNFTTTIWEGACYQLDVTCECCMILDSVADWIVS